MYLFCFVLVVRRGKCDRAVEFGGALTDHGGVDGDVDVDPGRSVGWPGGCGVQQPAYGTQPRRLQCSGVYVLSLLCLYYLCADFVLWTPLDSNTQRCVYVCARVCIVSCVLCVCLIFLTPVPK